MRVFERRLQVLLGIVGVALLIIVGRLTQLQIVQADYYRKRAQRSLRHRPTQIPFVRGGILDRTGETLVRDEPCWNLTIDYDVIAADMGEPSALQRQAKLRRGRYPHAATEGEIEQAFRNELAVMWSDIARFTSTQQPFSVKTLRERARAVYDRVLRIRQAVAARRGFDAPVLEETVAHAVVFGLDPAQQIAARELFAVDSWVHVESSSTRRFTADASPFAHLLGRMGRVDAARVATDPNADDPFAKYRADERLGIAGVEFAAEAILRGRRGQVMKDAHGEPLEEGLIEAENGRDVTLTVHADLQRRLYLLLGEAVDAIPESSGGSIVVLDVSTREVLALVSYPSYDPNRFHELYPALRDDTDRLPLRFRALANRYAPGSTVKPLVGLAGLMNGRITMQTHEVCTGYLFEDVLDHWRCWQIHGTSRRKAHGSVDIVQALTGSCNVFMYRLGEKLGVDGLCSVFDMLGIGRPSGTGLREEAKGINPTPSWLMASKNIRATAGMARLFAIGQGELAMTPVQVANLMATYANGRYRPVTLIRTDAGTPEWILPATPEQWGAIRRGIYGVVNDPTGTAYRYARFEHDRWVFCGKSGSATAHPWPTSYRIPYVDEEGAAQLSIVPGGTARTAIERFLTTNPTVSFDAREVEVASRWPRHPPPAGQRYSHAWFGGFLQPLDGAGQPDWSREAPIAFVVLVEFGGSGGRTSGPLAKAVVRELLNAFGPDLQVRPTVAGSASARPTLVEPTSCLAGASRPGGTMRE